jgi:hypothetical protein
LIEFQSVELFGPIIFSGNLLNLFWSHKD